MCRIPLATSSFISSSAPNNVNRSSGLKSVPISLPTSAGIRELRGTAIIVNGTADHVHMLVRMRLAQSAADLVRLVKTNSSRWAKAKGKSDFAWQTGYGAFSVSESKVVEVTRYIAGQGEHHKKHSFQEEFLAFLRKNHVPFDEKCLWIDFLSPFQGCSSFISIPTASAVGCILPPLRGCESCNTRWRDERPRRSKLAIGNRKLEIFFSVTKITDRKPRPRS